VRCEITYSGPSYPQYHGTQCSHDAEHAKSDLSIVRKHAGIAADGMPIRWFTEEQKQERVMARALRQ
jgi:hypothetical protein